MNNHDNHENNTDLSELQSYIDGSFVLMSNIVNEKYKDLEDNLTKGQAAVENRVNSTIVEGYHNLFVNICNENFKKMEELKKQIKTYFTILVIINIIIWITVLAR